MQIARVPIQWEILKVLIEEAVKLLEDILEIHFPESTWRQSVGCIVFVFLSQKEQEAFRCD